jgi:hypothetical protein
MDALAQPIERHLSGHVAGRITAMTDTRATHLRLEVERRCSV